MKIRALIAITIISIITFLACSTEKPEVEKTGDAQVSQDLREMVDEDQRLRNMGDSVDYEVIFEAGERHREKVFEYLAQGAITDPIDLYRASFILQHADPSRCSECYLLAYQLSLEAVNKGFDKARSLTAMNLDRYLVFTNQPQRYGTQYNIDSTGRYFLYEVDRTVSDSERAAWNVAPLGQLRAFIDSLNRAR
jgi:hypothetical protein